MSEGEPPAAASERLAEGIYRITGGYVALAVEFNDHILIFEPAGQNDARAQAIIAEAKRVIPNKPIRYGVLSHHHFDHTSGIGAVVAEGITIVTHEVNKEFFENALSGPRTLAPDAVIGMVTRHAAPRGAVEPTVLDLRGVTGRAAHGSVLGMLEPRDGVAGLSLLHTARWRCVRAGRECLTRSRGEGQRVRSGCG